MHFYPQGAIQTLEAIPSNVYKVYAFGIDSFIVTMLELKKCENRRYTFFKYTSPSGGGGDVFPSDCNIGSHHNNHYLFAKREDAEAYLSWAKTNTERARFMTW